MANDSVSVDAYMPNTGFSSDFLRKLWQRLLAGALICVLGAILAPRVSYERNLPVSAVEIIDAHSLEWKPEVGTVNSGRDDPHFEIVPPWMASPVTTITLMVEPIWGNVGVFQFYYIPLDPPEPYFNARWRTDVNAEIYGGIHPVKADFPETADRIRIDPPDGARFKIHSVSVRAWPGRHKIVLQTLSWLALVLGLSAGVIGFRASLKNLGHWVAQRPRWLMPAMVVLVAVLRLWLTATQPLKAVGGAMHDDQLFIDQAASIVEGKWLGPYNHLTLVKGQGYPLWIAAMFLLGVPLVFSQHLIYAVSSVLAYRSWRPVFSPLWRWVIVTVVLFNPASFHGDDSARILRNHFCASLAVLCFVCASGWFLRARENWRTQWGWAAGTGAAFSAIWLTREETIWITGVLGLFLLATLWSVRRENRETWKRLGIVALTPICLWIVAITAICAVNYQHYGFWGTVEFRASAFKDAYGALARINVGPWRQFVPVSREMREAAYAVSPTFSRMRPYLEGQLGEGWASLGESQTGIPARERQIHGAAFMWALRDGAAAAGEHLSCGRAMDYYRKMADEINTACDGGKVPALGHRSGFMPPWRPEYTQQFPGTYLEAWRFISTFIYVVPKPPPSTGSDESLRVYRELTHTMLSPRLEDPPLPPYRKHAEDFKNGVLKDVTRIYAFLTVGALLVSLPLLLWLWWLVWRKRRSFQVTVLATVALAGAMAITLVVTLVHMTSFVAITIGYQAAAYPLMLLFVVLTAAGLSSRPPATSPAI